MSRKVFKLAFLYGLLRDALEVQPGIAGDFDFTAPAEAHSAQWAAMISLARTHHAEGRLAFKSALRVIRILLDLGRAAEALGLLLQGPGAAQRSAEWSLMTAQAWLALGAAHPALAALRRVEALGPSAEQAGRAEVLQRLAALTLGQARPASWTEAAALLDHALALALPGAGRLVLQAHLAAPRADADPDAVIEAAFALLRLLGPDEAAALLAAMANLYESAALGSEWRRVFGLLRGMAESAPGDGAPADDLTDPLRMCLAEACAAGGLWREAIARFIPGHNQTGILAENMCELARAIGQDVLSGVDLDFQPARERRVFDLFPFNGEFAMLELKLAEMSPFIERFVIIEAAETFTGKPKPLYFQERRAGFARYADKIVHVVVDKFPSYLGTAWAREFYQRDRGILGLVGLAAPDDVVIISDVDEIIRPEAALGDLPALAAGADLRTFQYFLNYELLSDKPKLKTVLAHARLLARNGSSYLRIAMSRHARRPFLANAGWHFSSCGSPEALERKFQSFSHTEWAHLDRARIAAIADGIRSRAFEDPQFARRELGEDFPAFIRARPDLYADYVL